MRRIAAVLGLVLAIAMARADVVLAEPMKSICELRVTPSEKVELGYVLGARVRTTDGRPVNETTVRFYEIVDLFGTREMVIGSATTDGQGNAELAYLPAQPGTHRIVARSAARGTAGPAEATASFEATVAAPDYRSEGMPLASFTAAVPIAVGALVVSVWALIAFALFSTARGVRSGARDYAHREDTA